MSDWTSMEDNLPPDNKYILIYTKKRECFIANYVPTMGRFVAACWGETRLIDSGDIMCWTSLPKPPRTEGA